MQKYVYTPKVNKAKPTATVALLCALSLLVLLMSVDMPYPSLWQGGGVILLVAAVFMGNYYLIRTYSYAIESRETGYDEEETSEVLDFVVRMNGKTTAMLETKWLASVTWVKRGEKNPVTFAKCYHYSNEWMAPRYCRLIFRNPETEAATGIEVRIQADDELYSILSGQVHDELRRELGL